MKKVLAGVLVASLVGLMAVAATAQVPNLQIYFNANLAYNSYADTQSDCRQAGTQQELYVVMNNWNMFVQAVDMSIDGLDAQGPLFYGGESAPENSVTIGTSPSMGGTGGVAIAWQLPQNGFLPLLALTVHTTWVGNCDCNAGPKALVVRGYHYAEPTSSQNPKAVSWPDYVEHEGVGMTSLICPGFVATKQSTWGGVKALYR